MILEDTGIEGAGQFLERATYFTVGLEEAVIGPQIPDAEIDDPEPDDPLPPPQFVHPLPSRQPEDQLPLPQFEDPLPSPQPLSPQPPSPQLDDPFPLPQPNNILPPPEFQNPLLILQPLLPLPFNYLHPPLQTRETASKKPNPRDLRWIAINDNGPKIIRC